VFSRKKVTLRTGGMFQTVHFPEKNALFRRLQLLKLSVKER
jgi:hypothetical protein